MISRFDQILTDLRQRVLRREFEALPPERTLAQHYEVSQATMNKVVATLVTEGLVARQGTRGPCVPTPKKKPTRTVRFVGWIAAEALGAGVWDHMRGSFEKRNPNVQVESTSIHYDHVQQRLTEMVGAGNAPDVAQIVNNWTSSFAGQGSLVALDGKLPRELTADHVTWRNRANQLGGTTYSIDWGISPVLMFYNKAVMKRAGLDPDRPPQTLTELVAMSEQIVRKTDAFGFGGPATDVSLTGVFFLPFLFTSGGKIVDEDGSVTIDRPEAVAALDKYRKLMTTPVGTSIWELRKLFGQDRVAFVLDGPMGPGHYRIESGMGSKFDPHFGAAAVPTGALGRAATICVNHSLAIFRQTTAEKESLALIEHLLSDRGLAKQYFEVEGLLPARESLLALPEYRTPYARLVLEQARAAVPIPAHYPTFLMAMEFLGHAIHRCLKENLPSETVLRETAENIRLLFQSRKQENL